MKYSDYQISRKRRESQVRNWIKEKGTGFGGGGSSSPKIMIEGEKVIASKVRFTHGETIVNISTLNRLVRDNMTASMPDSLFGGEGSTWPKQGLNSTGFDGRDGTGLGGSGSAYVKKGRWKVTYLEKQFPSSKVDLIYGDTTVDSRAWTSLLNRHLDMKELR